MDVTSRVDTTSRGERRRKRDELKAGAPVTSEDEARQWSVKFGSATPKSPEIPKNQRCVGDYCHVQIHDPKQLFTEEEMRAFTGSDVDALRSLVRDTYAEGPTTEVAFRSIYLAGREKRGFKEGQERRDDGVVARVEPHQGVRPLGRRVAGRDSSTAPFTAPFIIRLRRRWRRRWR